MEDKNAVNQTQNLIFDYKKSIEVLRGKYSAPKKVIETIL